MRWATRAALLLLVGLAGCDERPAIVGTWERTEWKLGPEWVESPPAKLEIRADGTMRVSGTRGDGVGYEETLRYVFRDCVLYRCPPEGEACEPDPRKGVRIEDGDAGFIELFDGLHVESRYPLIHRYRRTEPGRALGCAQDPKAREPRPAPNERDGEP